MNATELPRTIRKRTRDWLFEPTPRIQMLPAYVILAIGLSAGVAQLNDLSAQRAEDARAFASQATERQRVSQCIYRVETRDSLRSVLLGITGLFPREVEGEPTGVVAIEQLIANDYPPITLESCLAETPPAN